MRARRDASSRSRPPAGWRASTRRRDRLTLTEVRRRILEQTTVFQPEDVIPVPCHPDCLAMAYALKLDGHVIAAHRHDRSEGAHRRRPQHDRLRAATTRCAQGIFKLFATNHSPESSVGDACATCSAACRRSQVPAGARLREHLPRSSSCSSSTRYAFDVRSVKKTLRAHRPPGRPAHPVRHLQPVLPRRPGADALAPLRRQQEAWRGMVRI